MAIVSNRRERFAPRATLQRAVVIREHDDTVLAGGSWRGGGPVREDLPVPAAAIAAVGIIVVIVAIALSMAAQLEALRPDAACLTAWATDVGSQCEQLADWLAARGGMFPVRQSFAFVPLLAAGLLGLAAGSALGSRDPGDGARTRGSAMTLFWVAVGLSIAAAVAGGFIEMAVEPTVEPHRSLEGYGGHGIPVVSRAIAVFALAMLAGVLIRRRWLRAIALGAATSAVLALSMIGFPFGMQANAVDIEQDGVASGARGDRSTGRLLMDGAGGSTSVLAAQLSYMAIHCPGQPAGDPCVTERDEWIRDNYTYVAMMLPGTTAHQIAWREAALLGTVAGLAALTAIGVGSRRRGTK